MKQVERFMAVAAGKMEADLVLKNAFVFHSFVGRFFVADLAIMDGSIVGMGTYVGRRELDFEGKFITPGFIDALASIETALLSPAEFSRIVAPLGTTTVVADAKRSYLAAGQNGMTYLLECTKQIPVAVYFSLLQETGNELYGDFYRRFDAEKRVLRLGKKQTAFSVRGSKTGNYAAFGETLSEEGLEDEIDRMYYNFQDGGVAFLGEAGIAACQHIIDSYTSQLCSFSTQGFRLKDILDKGHVNHLVRTAVENGYGIEMALQMATLYPARIWGLSQTGAIAPGYRADLLVFDDLKSWRPAYVFKDGVKIAEQRKALFCGSEFLDLAQTAGEKRFFTKCQRDENFFIKEIREDSGCCKSETFPGGSRVVFASFERGNLTCRSLGFDAYGLKRGAFAMTGTIQQFIAIGADPEDLMQAFQKLCELGGGMVVYDRGEMVCHLPLPLLGLMSDQGIHYVDAQLSKIRSSIWNLGVEHFYDPVLLLEFLNETDAP